MALLDGQTLGFDVPLEAIGGDDGFVDTAAMRPIMRTGYKEYFIATPETKFAMTRPPGG